MSKKRERSINFSREEVDLLVKLVEVNKKNIENKKSDAVTWHQKEELWKAIEGSFNAASGSTHRNYKTLRTKYEGLKREVRKKSALIRAETYRTGGGPSTAPILTPIESKVKGMILLSADGMDSNFDSDYYQTNTEVLVTSPVPKIASHYPVLDSNLEISIDVVDTDSLYEIIHSPSHQEENTEVVGEIFVGPIKKSIPDTEETAELKEANAETVTKRSNLKPSSSRSKKTPTLSDTEETAELKEANAETVSKWSNWKPSSLRSKKHPVLCNTKPKRPFEKLANDKIEVTALQKQILEEEFKNKKRQWAFEEEERQHKRQMMEEERQHKRQMMELEKNLLLKKIEQL